MKHRKIKRNQEPQSTKKSEQDAPSNKTAQDDRNLVLVDDDFEEADFEERMWLFWNRNKQAIVTGIAATFIAIFGVYGYQEYLRGKLEATQQAYMNATTPEEKTEFAKQHSENILAGIATLQLADEAYQAEDYARAAELYEQAIKTLDTQTAGPRAKLGLGVSLAKQGENDRAIQTLESLLDDPESIAAIKAEAAYHLAVLSLGDEDYETARHKLEYITSLDGQRFWNERARMLQIMLPKKLENEAPAENVAPATEQAPEETPS